MNVFIIDRFPAYFLQALEQLPVQLSYMPDIGREEVLARMPGQHILILNSKVRVDRELIDASANLELVVRAGVGLDHFDLPYLAQKGIKVRNTPGANANSVAEQTLGMLLALRHHILRADAQVKQFQWNRAENRGHEVYGKTVGLIGYGHTGSAVAKRLAGFGCRILAYDKYLQDFGNETVEEVQMNRIFEEADILSLHVPLTEETHFLVDEAYLAAFHKPITLLNLARGPVVKLEALLAAMDTGKVQAAGLDVLENEKLHTLTPRQQKLYEDLFARDNVILTPHIGGWSFESRENICRAIVAHIREHIGAGNV